MTEKIYYNDAYAQDFSATVLESLRIDGRPVAVLDRTCFYPESGGQPWDVGFLGDRRVVEVVEQDDKVLHFLDGEPPPPGSRVEGRIDWGRRFDFMQQHTGQHILSQACRQVLGTVTLSSHLGETDCTIELEREIAAECEVLGQVEDLANRVVFENRPVKVRFVSGEEAQRLGVRKLPEREGEIRLIEVADFDRTACGGTHCRQTGEVGLILVTGLERIRRRTRLHFVCGHRALRQTGNWRAAVGALTRLLSVAPEDLAQAVEERLERLRSLQKEVDGLREEYLIREFLAAIRTAETLPGGGALAVVVAEQSDAKLLGRAVSRAIAERPEVVVLAGSVGPGTPTVLARGTAAPAVDLRRVFSVVAELTGARGGGTPERVQGGGGDSGHLAEALERGAAVVRRELGKVSPSGET